MNWIFQILGILGSLVSNRSGLLGFIHAQATGGADVSARNYFAVAQAALLDLEADIQAVLNDQFNSQLIFKTVVLIISAIFIFAILQGVWRGARVRKCTAVDILHEVLNVLWEKGPRILWYLALSLALFYVTGLSGRNFAVTELGGATAAADPDNTIAWMGQTFSSNDWLGSETVVPKPLTYLKSASDTAVTAINGMDMTMFQNDIKQHLDAAVAKATTEKVGMGDAVVGAGATGIAWMSGGNFAAATLGLITMLLDQLISVILNIAFIFAQYSMAKALLLNYLYLAFAWNIALHFLPVFAILAYFRPLQGFLINIFKHLFAMAIAACVIGLLAKTLYANTFWIGANGTSGLIGTAFTNAAFVGDSQWAAGSFPWLTQKYGWAIGMLQVIFLMGAIGMILNEVYGIVRGCMDGVMRTNYVGRSSGAGNVFGGQ